METQLLEIRDISCDEISQLSSLLDEHWLELAKNKNLMILSPDLERYRALEDSGKLFAIAAYLDGEVVGYSVNFLTPHMHYSGLFCCYNDLLFVTKKYRNNSIGGRVIAVTEKMAKERGAQVMFWHAKENTPLSELLPYRGCKLQELVFSKEL